MFVGCSLAQDEVAGSVEEVTLDADLGASREGSRTGQLRVPIRNLGRIWVGNTSFRMVKWT